jgi:hypothetical protein
MQQEHPVRRPCRNLVAALWLLAAPAALAQPSITPDAPVMNLDELGVYAVGYAYTGQTEQQFPLGWSGHFEDRTGVSCLPHGEQNGRRAFLLHCPWRSGTGLSFQQFSFRLPTNTTRILLRGATAMKSDIVTNSDGVTFRLYTNGAKALDYHQTNDTWRDFEFDLTALRGSNLTVRFEVHPGSRNNASFDYSFWGGRELVLEGYTPTPVVHPAPLPLALSNVWSTPNGEVAPLGGFAGTTNVWFSNDVVRFRYTGPDGTLEYLWGRPLGTTNGLFGTLTLNAQMAGDAPVTVPLANAAALTWTATATAGSSSWVQTNLGYTLVRSFTVSGVTATVRITGRILGKSLVFEVSCDQPRVTALDIGAWGPVVRRRQAATPYYSGTAHLLVQENLFANASLDWTASAATSHSGSRASYGALTDGTRNLLRERAVFTAAWHLAEVLPNIPNPPSPWREFLADKVVLDNWGGSFNTIANNLTNLADYGVTNCVALIHVWQRDGYDNGLPAHYPANAGQGGDAAMSNLVHTGLRLGIRCALHENYVDYYPNYEYFDTNDIALSSSGSLQLAWFNEGTGIQSFAVKPNAIPRLAAAQSPEIHRRYGTKANYLDVHSAVSPWFHVDMRAGEAGAGQFRRVWDAHNALYAYERAVHDGPVFGEGNRHWYWSGYLDGVEAQFGSGWPGNGGFTAPLSVEFDLLRIHPLQFNHGMGYYERWWPHKDYATNWAGLPPMVVLDQYRMQEVAYGHAGFLAGSTYNHIPLAWLEHHLLNPVMARYGAAGPVEILYENGGAWLDASAAARLDNGGANSRVRIRYDNGLVITANSDSNALSTGGWALPQFGWLAQGAGLRAGTVLREGVVTDFADAGDSLFVNARPSSDWNLSSLRRIRPTVASFQQTASRQFRVTYQWDVQEGLGKNYTCFVHFCTNGVIRWQQDHSLTPPTSQWQAGQLVGDGPWTINISTDMPDGDYDWLIGLFDAGGTGARLRLLGVDDGTSRIRLGVLRITNSGALVTFTAETNTPTFDPSAWYSQHLNLPNLVVDFGDVRTDGSARLVRNGTVWSLQTWPRARSFTVELSSQRFDRPAVVHSLGGSNSTVTPVPVAGGARWRLPLNGAREYRWTNTGFRASSLVPTGAVWKYLDTGANLGTAWRALSYNDSAWPGGRAQLGFGDGDEATVIASNRQITTYFRRAFVISNKTDLTGLSVRLLRDDGAVVYLNNTEVFRSNMTNGPIAYNTLALANASSADETTNFHATNVSVSLLALGTNLLAVEVHQASASSSDLSFDLELLAMMNSPPAVSLLAPRDGLVAALDTLPLVAAASDPEDAVTRVDFLANGALLAADARRLTSPSDFGLRTSDWESEPPAVGCYGTAWSNVPPGEHVLTARVTDAGGRAAESAPVRVSLGSPVSTLVGAGSVWKYNDTGANLGTAWRAPDFDDSAWPSGPAQLGYGDYDEATVTGFGPNPASKYITTYFRRSFAVPDPTNFATLLLRVLCDDGAVVYLNGTQVWRNNLNSEPLIYTTLADQAVTGGDESTNFHPVTVAPALLVAGTNVLAVEVHQNSPESSDLSFDLELLAFPPGALPRLAIAPAGPAAALQWPAWGAGFVLRSVAALPPGTGWSAVTNAVVTTNGWFRVGVPAEGAARFYQLQRP